MNEALIRQVPGQQVQTRAALGKQKVWSPGPSLCFKNFWFKGVNKQTNKKERKKKKHPDGKLLIIRF